MSVIVVLLVAYKSVNAQNIVLENDHLYIELQKTVPYVEHYLLKSNSEVIYGDLVNEMFFAGILYQDVFYTIEPSIDSITQGSKQVSYHLLTEIDSKLAVTFDLSYILEDYTVKVVFNNVKEMPGYKLTYVRSPDLITIRGTQTGAKLVFPYAEGRLIDVITANTAYEEVSLEYTGWYRPLQMGMLYHNGLAGVVYYDHLDMVLWTRVFDHSSEERLTAIGMNFRYRYEPTNFSSATFIDVFDSETDELTAYLVFTGDYDMDLDIDWIDGAKILRDQVQTTPDPRYLSSFITKIGRIGHISEHLKTIEKLYHLTNHNKIHGYLLDYNSDIYWEIFGVEEDLGTDFASLEELEEVFKTAEESYNVFLSFHDNYTDYYPGSPGYDPLLRVIRDDGTPAPGWPTEGFPETFVTDPYDYAIQEGLDRVRRSAERYPIKESHHIDVLSLLFHNDFSPGSPSSRERNRRGIKLIIDEFNKYGIDVTSEGLTGQFVESGIGWFLDTPRHFSNPLSFGNEKLIPLIEFIYHGKTLYGLYEDIYYEQLSPDKVQIYTFLDPLLLGANSASHITFTEETDLEIDKFYLIDLPWMALNQRFMEDYEANGSYQKITYDEDTFVKIDYENNTYTVQVDGKIIGKNYTTYFQKDENTFLIFSRDEKTISMTLPQKWEDRKNNIKLNKLTEIGVGEEVSFEISDLIITFNAEANVPYRLILLLLEVFPKSLSFGNVNLGNSSLPQSISISNVGELNLNISDIQIKGTGSSDFSIPNDNCSGQTTEPSQKCTVEVIFEPTSVGPKSAVLSITYNNLDDNNVEVTLTGNATATATTTTTSVCPSESIYGEHSEQTEHMRHFRDNVLVHTPAGQEIIRLYYEWSLAIVQAMEADEEFRKEVKEMVDGVLILIIEDVN